MKVPDKIYAGFDKNTHLESYCTEKKGKCQTEYIRKDALLDWLKDMIDYSSKERQGAYQNVIDKIKSL